MAFFPLPTREVTRLLPTERFRPVEVVPGTSLVSIVAFEYRDTDIGPYNELGICYPILFQPRFPLPLLPLLLERRYPGLGFYIQHLPVTTEVARRAGVEFFGYPKFVGDIRFEQNAAKRTCHLFESGKRILSLTVDNPGKRKTDSRVFTTYSVRDEEILKTDIRTELEVGTRRRGGATLDLGEHPIAGNLRGLSISERALEIRYIFHWKSILPAPCMSCPLW